MSILYRVVCVGVSFFFYGVTDFLDILFRLDICQLSGF